MTPDEYAAKIRAAITQANGHRTEAAAILGIDRHKMLKDARKLGLGEWLEANYPASRPGPRRKWKTPRPPDNNSKAATTGLLSGARYLQKEPWK